MSGGSDPNNVQLGLEVTGAESAAAEINKATEAVKANTSATEQNAKAEGASAAKTEAVVVATKKATAAKKENAKAASEQAKKVSVAGVEIDKLGSSLGLAGQAVGRLNSTAGAMVTTLGSATGAIQSMASAGLGPLGAAVAAVNLAITAGVTLWGEYTDQQRIAQERVDSLKRSFDDLLTAQRASNQEASRERRLASGQGTAEEQDAYAAQTGQLQRRLIELGGDENVNAAQALEPTRQLRLRMAGEARARELAAASDAELVAQNATQLAENQRAIAAAEATGDLRDRRGSGAGMSQRDRDNEKFLAGKRADSAAVAAAQAEQERLAEIAASVVAREAEASAQAIAAQKQRDLEIYEARMTAEEKVTAMMAAAEDERKAQAEAADQARVESFQKAADLISSIGSATASVYGIISDASASADESEEQKQKRQLKRTAFDQSIQALVNTAQSIASFASQNYPAGIGYAAAAAVNVAAAVKAGGDAASVPSSGGGGRAAQSDSASRQAPASSKPTTVVVNMNGPTIATADRAELGRQIGSLVDLGRGRYG